MTRPLYTLLLVKDLTLDREHYRRYLLDDSSCEYRVLEAESARAALELCRKSAIDAIVLDDSLSNSDGLTDSDGLTFLRSLSAECNRPAVVMVSEASDERIIVQAMKLGAEDYLAKQRLTPELLQSTLRSAIENSRSRQQLHQSEERYRGIVENQTELICRFLPDGTLTFVSQTYSHYFGTSPEQLIGQNFLNLVPERDRVIVQQQIAELLTATPEQAIITQEHPVLKPNGEIGWQQWTNRAIFDSAGQIVEFQAVGRDISDRRQHEAYVQRQLAQIEAIYATAPIGLCFLDRERRFVQVNERLAEVNGLPVSEHLGRTVREILPDLADVQEPIFEQVLQTGVPILDVEVQGRTPAQPGVDRDWLVNYYPLIAPNGEILGINIMVQEITERKQAEQKLKAVDRSKDEFVAMVAHELRSPLNSIAGWTKLLQTRELDAATTAKALDTIYRNTQAQVQLVEDLLDISRMVRGTFQIQSAPVELAEVIGAALEIVRPEANAKQIQLEMQLSTRSEISGDFNRLQQIVVNLLTNAIKFTPNGGRAEVALTTLTNETAQIRVCDTGAGIESEFLPHVFERFRQADGDNTRRHGGLGLGLSIVRHLVELHGGTVSVESPGVGKGTTFIVKLPIKTDRAAMT